MNILQKALAKLERFYEVVEEDVKKELTVLDEVAGNFLHNVEPAVLASVAKMAKELEQEFLADPSAAFTTLLGKAENLAHDSWKAMSPTLQSDLLLAVSSMVKIGATIL